VFNNIKMNIEDNCVICMSSLREGDSIQLPSCGHIFHSTCIVQWYLDTTRGCPLCRSEPEGTFGRFMSDQGKVKLCQQLSRRKKCNIIIKRACKKLTEANKELKNVYSERAQFNRENREILKKYNSFRQLIWEKKRNIRKANDTIKSIPMLNLIQELRKRN